MYYIININFMPIKEAWKFSKYFFINLFKAVYLTFN